MQKFFSTFFLLTVLSLCSWFITSAQDFQVGQAVNLQATKPIGVPLHRKPATSYLKHVPSGTPATIEGISTPWLKVRFASGDIYWVHAKYVEASSSPSNPLDSRLSSSQSFSIGEKSSTIGNGEKAVWAGREQCEKVVNRGSRMALPSSSRLRVTTWNLRWFPTGKPADQPEDVGEPTDLEWLTCAIRWMQIDIVALQEILATPEATRALKILTDNLTTQTGQTWRWYRQPCGRPDDHHVGLVWNETLVSLTNFDSLWQFNSKAIDGSNPCTYGLRPGQYAWVQSRTADGVDFHLVTLHLKSGPTVFDVEERHKALNRIDEAMAPFLEQDQDVVIVGDFNTMGAGNWNSRQAEIKNLRRHLEKEKPGFVDLEPTPQCSHYFRGRGSWLDHVLVSRGMQEIPETSVQVTGYCAVAGCRRIRGDYPPAYRQLSDHCPIVLEIENQDQD